MYGTFFNLSYTKLATYGDTSAPFGRTFFLGLMNNTCAQSLTQDIKRWGPLLSLFGVPPKNPLSPLQAFVITVLLTVCFSLGCWFPILYNTLINQLEILLRAAQDHCWMPLLHPTSLLLFKNHLPFENNQTLLTYFKRVLRFLPESLFFSQSVCLKISDQQVK